MDLQYFIGAEGDVEYPGATNAEAGFGHIVALIEPAMAMHPVTPAFKFSHLDSIKKKDRQTGLFEFL
ncbi:MAG: hypothetical protein V4722_27085 [Bacteroidota bacterium]